MKKYATAAVSFALVLAAAAPAYAASISLSPTTISVVRGQTVIVNVVVDSGTAQTVTAEAQLSYPANILTPTSFAFGPSWMQLSQPGYDAMGSGSVIKTAGYPGGFMGVKTLGTLTFTASQTGSATIAVLPASQTFASQGGSTLTAPYGTTQVNVGGSSASQTTTTTTNANGQTTTVQTTSTTGTTVTPGTTNTNGAAAATAPTTDNTQGAAVATSGAASAIPTWGWIVGAIVLLALIAWGVRSYSKKAN